MQGSTLRLAALAFSGIVSAQNAIVIPNGFATTEGSTSNAFPWSSSSAVWPGLRTICIYGSSNFTAQSVGGPIVITRLRWRADGTATSWTGGTFSLATVKMATAAVAYNAPSTNLPSNFGPDYTTVYAGPVTCLPGPGSVPGPWIVDVTLATPFPYDPSNGPLAIDVDINNSGGVVWSGGSTPQLDVDASTNTQASRVYISSLYPTANGTTYPHGVIVEVTYLAAQGAALAVRYGAGCYNRPGSFYENFASASAFDLANSAMSMIYNGSDGYIAVPGIASYVAPTAAAAIVANGDETEQTVTLASPLPVPGGTTTALNVCSNGYIATATGNGVVRTPSPAAFLGFSRTCWATWHDFNPLGGGLIKFEQVGSVSYVTWAGVADASGGGTSTFQYQFDRSSGIVNVVWGAMSTLGTTGYLVGFHKGGSSLDPGNRDISATLASSFTCGTDVRALDLAATARPIVGTSMNLVTANVPGNSPVGVNLLSFTQHDPGLDLTPLGMPGCRQYAGLDVSRLFIPAAGQGTSPFVLPNVPAYSGLICFSQSAAFSAGANPLGVIASNGLTLTIGIH